MISTDMSKSKQNVKRKIEANIRRENHNCAAQITFR
jgi:hypothetical protein